MHTMAQRSDEVAELAASFHRDLLADPYGKAAREELGDTQRLGSCAPQARAAVAAMLTKDEQAPPAASNYERVYVDVQHLSEKWFSTCNDPLFSSYLFL